MDDIINLRKKIKICNTVSMVFVILAVVVLASEYIVAQFFADSGWALPLLRVLIYSFYLLPVGIVLPLFFRVNYKNKLQLAMKYLNKQS